MGQQHSNAFSGVLDEVSTIACAESVHQELIEWIQSSNSVNIFVTGKTGSGKSTLVNALIGQKVAPEGEDVDPMTDKVTCYRKKVSGIEIKVWDSPGLQDGTEKEAEYIEDMKTNCTKIDLCVLCINISIARFTNDSTEITALKKLTDAFGQGLWEHAMVALTYANELEIRNEEMQKARRRQQDAERRRQGAEPQQHNMDELCKLFTEKIREWDSKLRKILTETVGIEERYVQNLKIIPAGHLEPALPDRSHWLSTFWFSTLRSMHPRAQPALVLINHARIVESLEDISEDEAKKFLVDQTIVFAERGFEIGKNLHNPAVGAEVGQLMAHALTVSLQVRILIQQWVTDYVEAQMRKHEDKDKAHSPMASPSNE